MGATAIILIDPLENEKTKRTHKCQIGKQFYKSQ